MYVITLSGVLQQPNEAPNPNGIALYRALAQVGPVAVLCGPDAERADWFLRTNALFDHVHLVPEDLTTAPTVVGRRRAQITYLRARGVIDLVIDPDPDVVADMHGLGIATLLYLHPQFSLPSFRPDYEDVATPWSRLVETVDYQVVMKAKKVAKDEAEVEE